MMEQEISPILSNPQSSFVILKNAPFFLSWKDINYSLEIEQNNKKIQKNIIGNITGYAKSGELTAIMGPSGSGKTSLLNFLNNRIQFPRNSHHSGKIYINSEEISFQKVAKCSSYVMQDDYLFSILTPKETFMFAAMLKTKKTKKEHEIEVNSILAELKLLKCKDTYIGGDIIKGISGGERKRTSIGIEIISNPSILFLDEPTSGLDSTTSLVVVDYLKSLAEGKGKIVLFTIHQPSSNIFQLFGKLLLMNKGELVYQGNPSEAITFFMSEGFMKDSRQNPSDAIMHGLEEQNNMMARQEEETAQQPKDVREKEPVNKLYQQRISPKIENEIGEILNKGEKLNIPEKREQKVGFFREVQILSYRTWLNLIRNPTTLRLRGIFIIYFSFIALSIFYGMGNDLLGVMNKVGFLFFFSINNFMSIIFGTIMSFPLERGVFLREYSDKLYGVLPYYISKNLVETPFSLLPTLLYGIIVYYLAGLRSDVSSFFIFLCIFVVLAWYSHSIGYFFGASFSNVNTALIITQFSVLPFILFCGLIINPVNMPAWLAWLQYFSPFRYSLEASLRNEFDDRTDIPMNPVKQLNLDIGLWNCVIIMVAWGIGLRILGGLTLFLLVRKLG